MNPMALASMIAQWLPKTNFIQKHLHREGVEGGGGSTNDHNNQLFTILEWQLTFLKKSLTN